jgi:phage protein D
MPPYSKNLIPKFNIVIGGTEQRDLIGKLISAEVEDSIDKPSMFSLVLADNGGKWMDSPLLNPEIGGDVKISMDDKLGPLITGKIIALNPNFPSQEAQTLSIQGYDHSFFLQKTHSLNNPSVLKGKDISDLVGDIAKKNDLSCKSSPTGIKYSSIVLLAPGESDYSFLRRMADMAGFEFFVRDKVLHFQEPRYGDSATTLSWGENILSMNFRMSTARAVKNATILGYNPLDKKSYVSVKRSGRNSIFSGTSAAQYLDGSSGFESQILEQNIVLNSQSDIDILAGALLDRANNSFVEGNCEVPGDSSIRAGMSVNIMGAGKRFSGSYYVKSARHTIGEGKYILHLDLMSMVVQRV